MDGPALRLFGDGEPQPRSLTLRQAFDRYMREEITRIRAKSTLGQYETALRHWENFVAYQGAQTRTHLGEHGQEVGPPIREFRAGTVGDTSTVNTPITDSVHAVTDELLARFRRWLAADGMSDASIAKTWRYMRPLFNRLGPRIPGNPRGAGVITIVPYMSTELDVDATATTGTRAGVKRILTLDELDKLYKACSAATWPGGKVGAPALWRTLLVLFYGFGMRTQDLVQLPWSDVTFAPECPDEESTALSPHGWISFLPAKTRRRKTTLLILPLSEVGRRHLESIRCERDLVFAFPNSPRNLYGQWHELLDAAGVKRCDLKDLRKTCNVAYNRLSRGIGEWVLGHAPRGVNATFYQSIEQDLLDVVPRLPYSPAMVAGAAERQKWLW